jgi:hypothetical protein
MAGEALYQVRGSSYELVPAGGGRPYSSTRTCSTRARQQQPTQPPRRQHAACSSLQQQPARAPRRRQPGAARAAMPRRGAGWISEEAGCLLFVLFLPACVLSVRAFVSYMTLGRSWDADVHQPWEHPVAVICGSFVMLAGAGIGLAACLEALTATRRRPKRTQ